MSDKYTDQLMEMVTDCRERMVRVETMLTLKGERDVNIVSTQAEHERRITKLEANNRIMAAFGAALLVLLPFLQPFVLAWVSSE